MIHVMIDIETLGTESGCVIASVGAVKWDEEKGFSHYPEDKDREFYSNVSLVSCVEVGLELNPDTVQWWLQQDGRAQKALFDPKPQPLQWVLNQLNYFMPNDPFKVWSHGENFDLPILGAAYKASGSTRGWSYRQERDTRTIFDDAYKFGYEPEKVESKEKHHALVDAYRQARWVQEAMARINHAATALTYIEKEEK